jgi:hypothetical protein
VQFWLEREGEGDRFVVVTETGRRPRGFDRSTFDEFWQLWSEGKRDPDDFRTAGPTGGMFKLAYYLLPVAAAIEQGSPAGTPSNEPKRSYKYGDRPTWQLAVDAVRAMGGSATLEQISENIKARVPEFNASNVRPDLDLVSVNSFGRANWAHNQQPRRVDGSDVYDVLFMEEKDGRTVYTFYDPRKHGIWELAPVAGDSKLRPRRIDGAQIEQELGEVRAELEDEGEFDPDATQTTSQMDCSCVPTCIRCSTWD